MWRLLKKNADAPDAAEGATDVEAMVSRAAAVNAAAVATGAVAAAAKTAASDFFKRCCSSSKLT